MNKKTIDRYIEITRALKEKKQSGRSFHATFIFDKSKLLSIGWNDYLKEHRRHKFGAYTSKNKTGNYISGIHSESASIIKLGEQDCSNYTFLNIRIDNNGEVNIAKPCHNCMRLLEQVGFKRLIWTTKEGMDQYNFK